MDVENMHPFCLPFGSCHDATSSSATADFSFMHNNNLVLQDCTKDKINRSKTSSPTDIELFRDLNDVNSSTGHSLTDDSIIDQIDEDGSFYSLKLDFDSIGTEDSGNNNDLEFRTEDQDDDGDIMSHSNDWFYSQYPLYSPDGFVHPTRQKSSSKSTLSNFNNQSQVFQLMVDPIDIKSSPTLAQLNLNTNDDPADGLWDTTTNTTSISTNTDLYSNCTSISINRNGTGSSPYSNYVSCNNLTHHHSYNSRELSSYAHLNNTASQYTSCQHVHHQNNSCHISPQNACLSIQPLTKVCPSTCPSQQPQNISPCRQPNTAFGTDSPNGNIQNIKSSTALHPRNQHIDHANPQMSDRQTSFQSTRDNNKSKNYQRCITPPQVTSSSSPLGSQPSNENRTVDNKLKENIDYLTSLLCNGSNKIEGDCQQTIISSTMAKSYTTLAHSLSTGPRLLERVQNTPVGLPRLPKSTNDVDLSPGMCNRTISSPLGLNSSPQVLDSTRPCSSDHYPRHPVESSISAADSTEAQVTSYSNPNWMNYQCSNSNHLASNLNANMVTNPNSQKQSFSELKVLSSLLNNSNNHVTATCPPMTPVQSYNHNSSGFRCATIQPIVNHPQSRANTVQTSISDQSPTISHYSPIGKPITLTPISTNLSIQKIRPSPVFIQPASPSASSTASSGPNTDIGSSTCPIKRQRPTQIKVSKHKTSARTGRPNSMSTDCSLSSHDEGFGSQIDNDEAGSDDEDEDVDSDDESFYGDYTNSDLIGASISDDAECKWTLNMGRARRNGQKRYFWQYNVQSKGPKGTRICASDDPEDPFVLSEASDPVFSNDCQIEGVKHSGKARRGDGNDLTPNPKKLLMIGLELKKLSKIINDLAPVVDLPINARNKTRKEKNKLASRACRLKKKAQHEANKIKLYGLQREHQQVVLAIYDIRKLLNGGLADIVPDDILKSNNLIDNNDKRQTSQESSTDKKSCNDSTNPVGSNVRSIAERCSMTVAGQTSDYVNSILEKVVSGCIDGDLDT